MQMDTYTLLTVILLGGLVIWLWYSVFKGRAALSKKKRVRPRPTRHNHEPPSRLPGEKVEESEMQRLIEEVEKLSKQVVTVNNNLLVIGALLVIALLLINPACPVPRG